MAKSAISILEELAAANKIPKPQYNWKSMANGEFMCEVVYGNVNVSAVGINKKIAKHDCASLALEKLRYLTGFGDTILKQNSIRDDTPKSNSIGKLHELCSKNKAAYPDFVDHGWLDGEFIIECKCLTYTTKGGASTKKQAKDLAASEMLNRLDSSDFQILNTGSLDMNQRIIEVFENVCIKSTMSRKTDEVSKPISAIQAINSECDYSESVEVLHAQLISLGIKYEITVLQKNPLILTLVAVGTNGVKYTFLHSTGTYSECHLNLLRTAVEGIMALTL